MMSQGPKPPSIVPNDEAVAPPTDTALQVCFSSLTCNALQCIGKEMQMTNGYSSRLQSSDAQGQFNAAVDELLDQLQHKFDNVSREMFGKCEFTTLYHTIY